MSIWLSIRKTGDGSTTLYHEALNETYHSVHGAVTESQHVFISKGLEYATGIFAVPALNILEVGFGTGLNAALTLEFSVKNHWCINYFTLEKFPLSQEIRSQLEFPGVDPVSLQSLHDLPWDKEIKVNPDFSFHKKEADVLQEQFPENYFHIIFFDAFAPGKQPELWTPELFQKLHNALTQGGILVTYCARGQFKRDLKQAGFTI
ncbi:MAG: tRNA (5-methylaminomethyl-2-thiouridine)(34)-methyltransferase MnmD, partial [Cyclobacteriaceae bacterium]